MSDAEFIEQARAVMEQLVAEGIAVRNVDEDGNTVSYSKAPD